MTIGRLDTNIILRYVTDEPEAQAARSARLFKSVERGEEEVLLEEVILAEVVWTLSSYYQMPKVKIANSLLILLSLDYLRAVNKDALRLALVIFTDRNVDFADALLAAKALQSDDPTIYSFDRDFDRIPGIIRKEP